MNGDDMTRAYRRLADARRHHERNLNPLAGIDWLTIAPEDRPAAAAALVTNLDYLMEHQ